MAYFKLRRICSRRLPTSGVHAVGTARYRRKRHGAALIEFAICLPVFFTITMAAIETCHMVYLRQSLKIAAYECARLGICQGSTAGLLADQCDVLLLGRSLKNYTFTCVPSDPSTLQFGESFTTTVKIAAKDNALVGSWFYRDMILTESVTIMAEI